TTSTDAFFGKKVVLVEGDSDRYFFKSVFRALYPETSQDISILDIGGKGNFFAWRDFFESFGLEVCFIGDLDNIFTLPVSSDQSGSPISRWDVTESIRDRKHAEYFSSGSDEWKERLKAVANLADSDVKRSYSEATLVLREINQQCIVTSAEIIHQLKNLVPDIEDRINSLVTSNVFILRS